MTVPTSKPSVATVKDSSVTIGAWFSGSTGSVTSTVTVPVPTIPSSSVASIVSVMVSPATNSAGSLTINAPVSASMVNAATPSPLTSGLLPSSAIAKVTVVSSGSVAVTVPTSKPSVATVKDSSVTTGASLETSPPTLTASLTNQAASLPATS